MVRYIDVKDFVAAQKRKLDDARDRLDAIDYTLQQIKDAAHGIRRLSPRWIWLRGKYRFWQRRRRRVARLVARYTFGPDGVRPSKNFSWFEFADNRSGVIPRARKHRVSLWRTAVYLEQYRAGVAKEFGRPAAVIPTSVVRTPYSNRLANGGSVSNHTEYGAKPFSAVDLLTYSGGRMLSTRTCARLAAKYVPAYRKGGIGTYPTWNHFDHQPPPARRW